MGLSFVSMDPTYDDMTNAEISSSDAAPNLDLDPDPDQKAQVISKASSSDGSNVDSASNPVPSSLAPKDLEHELVRMISALVTPNQEGQDTESPPPPTPASDAAQLAEDQDDALQWLDVADEDDQYFAVEEDGTEEEENDNLGDVDGAEEQGGLFSEEEGDDQPKEGDILLNKDAQDKQELILPPADQESHLVPIFETGEPEEAIVPLFALSSSRTETDDASEESDLALSPPSSPPSPLTDGSPQDKTLLTFDSVQKSSSAGKGAVFSTSSSLSTTIPPTAPTVQAELLHLLWLILLLCSGMGLILILSLPRTRRYLFWPIRHWFYTKLPQQEQDASLERVMLRELGEDLIID
ncbi:hypothetical protein BGZ73_008586 [Actinomortierella ambigua]|nr:hypothetical protein BGZ73_008586 [Actinomortierella ambigua]